MSTFAVANLPNVASLTTALKTLEIDVGPTSFAILKMDKGGNWVFGADQTEVEVGSTWAINPFSFVHGFIAWGEREVLGEKLVPVTQPLPELEPAPTGCKKGWEKQLGFALRCVSGKRITTQVDADQTKPVPVVQLKKSFYNHKSYGKIYTPEFEVVEWISMEGAAGEEDSGEEAAPARRRRSA
jgi:hypothetical protein